MNDNVLLLVLIVLGLGVVLGRWWEQDRRGGTVDLDRHIDALETELEDEQLTNAILRAERDERRASSMYAAVRTTDLLDECPPPFTANPWLSL